MKQIEGTARRVLKESKPAAVYVLVVAIATLIYTFATRDAGSRESLIGISAFAGFLGGGAIMILLRDIP